MAPARREEERRPGADASNGVARSAPRQEMSEDRRGWVRRVANSIPGDMRAAQLSAGWRAGATPSLVAARWQRRKGRRSHIWRGGASAARVRARSNWGVTAQARTMSAARFSRRYAWIRPIAPRSASRRNCKPRQLPQSPRLRARPAFRLGVRSAASASSLPTHRAWAAGRTRWLFERRCAGRPRRENGRRRRRARRRGGRPPNAKSRPCAAPDAPTRRSSAS